MRLRRETSGVRATWSLATPRRSSAAVASSRLTRWLDELNWREALADPQLAVVRAFALSLRNSPTDVIESWVMVAEEGTHDGSLANTMPSLQFGASLVRSLFLLGGRGTRGRSGALGGRADGAGRRVAARGAARARADAVPGGHATAARKVLEQALLESTAAAPQTTASILAHLALIELDHGDTHRGESLARRSLATLEDLGLGELSTAGVAHLALGVALGAGGALVDAESEIERGAELQQAAARPSGTRTRSSSSPAAARPRRPRGRPGDGRGRSGRGRLPARRRDRLLPARRHEAQAAGWNPPAGRAGEELSQRELVILRLLGAGLTKPEIARELYIAYNTVKTHTRTIYRKLGASTRDEAVARARELKLI